jgi:hypothetical protein
MRNVVGHDQPVPRQAHTLVHGCTRDSLIDAIAHSGDKDSGDEQAGTDNGGPKECKGNGQRASRAKYMRFWRKVSVDKCTKHTPPEVLARVAQLRATGAEKGSLLGLYEDWCQASEDWMQTTLIVNIRKKASQRRKGVWVFMTKADILEKYKGDVELVDDLIDRKMKDGKRSWKDNPDFPGAVSASSASARMLAS